MLFARPVPLFLLHSAVLILGLSGDASAAGYIPPQFLHMSTAGTRAKGIAHPERFCDLVAAWHTPGPMPSSYDPVAEVKFGSTSVRTSAVQQLPSRNYLPSAGWEHAVCLSASDTLNLAAAEGGSRSSNLSAGNNAEVAKVMAMAMASSQLEIEVRVGDVNYGLAERFRRSRVPAGASSAGLKTKKNTGAQNFTWIQYGDMGIDQYAFNTVQRVKERSVNKENYFAPKNVSFVYHVGDIGYGDDRDSEFYEATWNSFFQQMTPVSEAIPYQLCPGNHEHSCGNPQCHDYSVNFTVYNNRFRMPVVESGSAPPEPAAGDTFPRVNRNMFFSWDWAQVHFVTIDTETDYPNAPFGDRTFGGKQLAWLEEDLKAASQRSETRWIVVIGHRPIYSSAPGYCNEATGAPTGSSLHIQTAFEDLFIKYGVDVYISGHVHSYERVLPTRHNKVVGGGSYNDPQGPVYFISGAAGNKEGLIRYRESPLPEWSAFRYGAEWGYAVINMVSYPSGVEEFQWNYHQSKTDEIVDWITVRKSAPSAGKV